MEFPGFSLDLSSLKKSARLDPDTAYDVLSVGGGPAAMSAAIYAERKMLAIGVA